MHLRKTKTNNGRIYLAIVDSFYDKQKKMSRSKTIESLGYLDVLEKEYDDPITHFQKRIEQLKKEKQEKTAPIHFTFYDSDRLCPGDDLRKNFGYAALSQIYHELGILSGQSTAPFERTVRCQRHHEDAGLFPAPFSGIEKIFL